MAIGQHIIVTVRGIDLEIVITHDHGFEADTGAHEVEWEPLSMSVDEYNSLNLSSAEENIIYDQIYKILESD